MQQKPLPARIIQALMLPLTGTDNPQRLRNCMQYINLLEEHCIR
jgi:hypothetical protein